MTFHAMHVVYENINLGSIFEKKNEQNYTDKAKLYQDILNFCIEQDEGGKLQFKHREIATWLLEHNEELMYFYSGSRAHTKKSIKIENTQERIKKRIDDLVKLDLLRVGETVQEKGVGTTNLYKITVYAILLGTLIKDIRASDEQTKKSADNRLYRLFEQEFSRYKTSFSQFKLRLYSKLVAEDLFTIFVGDVMRKALLSNTPPLNMKDLLLREPIITFDQKMKDKVDRYVKLWFESLNELDPETKSLLLFNIKTERENEIMIRSSGPWSYESMRFQYRQDYNSIVVEGLCNNCFYVQPRVIDIEGYLNFSLIRTDQSYALSRCNHCNDKGMVVLTNL
jgi:hypothetical protein